jgi:hypothetical protein
MNKRRISITLIVALMILAALACETTATPLVSEQPFGTASPNNQETLQAADAAAQATLAAGQKEARDLAYQATVVSLNMDQAAKAAAQTTLEYNQRQLMELSIRATEISQDMARAAATQQFIAVQTQMAWNATATAQSQAATATYAAYIFNFTQTAQVQAMLDVQASYTAQAYATQTAYSLTATPWAALQADILRTQNESDRRAWWREFVVTPLTVTLLTLVILLLIVGGVIAYRRLLPALELRLRTITRDNVNPPYLVEGTMVDASPSQQQLASGGTPQIEIVGPFEPSVTNWITEAEQELRSTGRMQA